MPDPATPAPSATPAPAAGATTATPTPAPGAAPAATAPGVDASVLLERLSKSDADRYRFEQGLKAESAARLAAEKRLADAEKDPWSYLQSKGFTPEMALERAAVGKPAVSEDVLKLQGMVQELVQWKADREAQDVQAQQARQLGGISSEARSFAAAANDPDAAAMLAYVDAVAGGQADFSAHVKAYQDQAKASGVQLTAAEAGAMLRRELADRAKAMRSEATRKAAAALFGFELPSTAAQQPGATPAQSGQSLTSGMAQAGAGGAVPDTSKMSQAEFEAYLKQKWGIAK